MADEGLLKAIDYRLDELTIVSSAGIAIRLNAVMRELNIFEDLFGNVMSGNIFINDSQNLINILPIVGAEYLRVKISKPSTPWKIEKVFRVYKITNRQRTSATVEDYILHFCSEELIINESTKISKAYKGQTISQIVKDIARTHLNIRADKFPSRELTSTSDTLDIVVPYWTPFYTINWLSRMARTGYAPGCSFVFYEDGEGFHFKPIEGLSQTPPLQHINFQPMQLTTEQKENTDKSSMEIRHESAEEYELLQAPDTLRSISTGLYSGRLIKVNPFEHRINISSLDGQSYFNNAKHPNKYTFMQTNRDRLHLRQNEHSDAYFRVAADNLKVDTWLLQRNAYMSGLHGFQLKVSVPGNMNFRVGRVVQLNLPAATAPTRDQKLLDELYSGKYMITSIHHKIDRNRYMCILELSKDSLVKPLPDAIEGHPAITEMRTS